MSYLNEAFRQICKDAKTPRSWYVYLVEVIPYYGGPEEGGWWSEDHIVQAYKEFNDEELASATKVEIEKLAEELSQVSVRDYGTHCLKTMEWLEARGLDADYLPEPDGPSKFYVSISEHVPEDSFGPRRYE